MVFDAIVVFLCVSDFVEMVNWVGFAKTLHTVSESAREREKKGWGYIWNFVIWVDVRPHGVGFLIIKLQIDIN